MIEVVLDGKRIALMGHEKFLVQVGKGPKGPYKTRYSFDTGGGNAEGAFLCLKEALFYYRAINVGYGYKKRLVCNEFTKRVLAKQFS